MTPEEREADTLGILLSSSSRERQLRSLDLLECRSVEKLTFEALQRRPRLHTIDQRPTSAYVAQKPRPRNTGTHRPLPQRHRPRLDINEASIVA